MPSPKSTAFPTAFQAVLLFVALFLSEYLLYAVLRDANGLLDLGEMQRAVLATVLGNGCVFAVVMHYQKLTYRELFHPSGAPAGAVLLFIVPPVLLLVPALIVAMTLALALLVYLVPLSGWEAETFRLMSDGSIASLLATCIVAPLLEEMLFRGLVLRGFLRRYSKWQAILGSALLFGAAHMNIYQFVVGMTLGVVLGWLYERTRSLIPCIALHAAYNSGLMLLSDQRDDIGVGDALSMLLLALVAAGCGVLALRRVLAPAPIANDAERDADTKDR